jgi:hypothetical protein
MSFGVRVRHNDRGAAAMALSDKIGFADQFPNSCQESPLQMSSNLSICEIDWKRNRQTRNCSAGKIIDG